MLPRPTLEAFDAFLATRELRLEAVVVGGAALALLGVTTRQTRDVDILAPPLSTALLEAGRAFASEMRGRGIALTDDWLNDGPRSLGDVLPEGWRARVQPAFAGRALVLAALGRADLLKSKLFALCDRGTDLGDCLALAPTPVELDEAEPWVQSQDTSVLWPEHVRATLDDLRRRLGDDL